MSKMMKNGLLGMCALVASAAIVGCNTQTPDTTADVDRTAPPATTAPQADMSTNNMDGTVTVADIVGTPTKYEGQTVTVVADLEEVHGPNAFSLDEDSAMTGGVDNDLLVFSSKAGKLAAIDDQWLNNKVRVTGTVRKWTVVDLERELGWDLSRELEADIETHAVMVATAMERVQD